MPSCLVGRLSGPASDGWMGWSKEGRAGLRQVREPGARRRLETKEGSSKPRKSQKMRGHRRVRAGVPDP